MATGRLAIILGTGCVAPQKVELKAARVVHVGTCDNSAGNYALAKKKMSMEVSPHMATLMPGPQTPYIIISQSGRHLWFMAM